MNRICTLCNSPIIKNDYSWESHLASDEHRHNKNAADRATLLMALHKIDAYYHDDLGAVFIDPNHPQNIARTAIAEVEGE